MRALLSDVGSVAGIQRERTRMILLRFPKSKQFRVALLAISEELREKRDSSRVS